MATQCIGKDVFPTSLLYLKGPRGRPTLIQKPHVWAETGEKAMDGAHIRVTGAAPVRNRAIGKRIQTACLNEDSNQGCPSRKSYPDVMMVQPADDRQRNNGSGALDGSRQRDELLVTPVAFQLVDETSTARTSESLLGASG